MATQDTFGTPWENDETNRPAEDEQRPGEEATNNPGEDEPTAQKELSAAPETIEATRPATNTTKASPARGRKINPAKMAAALHRLRRTSVNTDEIETATTATSPIDTTTEPELVASTGKSKKRWGKARKDSLQDWDTWSKFRLWRHTRPLWGSILMMLSSFILLALPLSLLPFAAFLPNTFGVALLVGGLLFIMALAQLIVPSYALLTGSIGILLALISFITSTFGGLLIGMLLGIIGGALSLAWRPVKPARLVATKSTN